MKELLQKVFDAGIVGAGGAGFPTHIKLDCKPKHLLINGAECEPLLRTDRYIMRFCADEIVNTLDVMCNKLGCDCYIALKSGYKTEISALEKAIDKNNSNVELYLLDSFYPAGDEQVLVNEVLGLTVPPLSIPLDVGCVVQNVSTIFNIGEALNGKSVCEKYLTVTGEVENPSVIKVPIGTSFADCINLVGGIKCEDFMIVSGGPMMGKRMSKSEGLNSYVTKTTSGILVLPKSSRLAILDKTSIEHIKNRAKSACIQCRMCTDMCPRHNLGHPIEPHKIMRKFGACSNVNEIINQKDVLNASLCSECGVCEIFACPMGLQPRAINHLIKGELAKQNLRYPKGEGLNLDNQIDFRHLSTQRASARAGVYPYYDVVDYSDIKVYIPDKVVISLKQHIGASAVAIVKDGDIIKCGELIAKADENALSANIHASINGKCKVYKNKIEIERV